MKRTLIGAGVGMFFGILTLAGLGSWAGYTHGVGTRLPPGWAAAGTEAFVYSAYFWWLSGTIGGVIGGLAGMGSWVVRPRSFAKSSVFEH
jgi:hypothetical protein